MEIKKCVTCGGIFPLTIEHFGKAKANKDGFSGQCKRCIYKCVMQYRKNNQHYKEYQREYKINNKEIKAEKAKQYGKENKEAIAKQRKCYKNANKKDIAEKDKIYREKNKEKIKIKRNKYLYNNKESISERTLQYREHHKEERKEYSKQYCKEHLEQYRINCHKRRAMKRKLSHTLTIAQWEQTKICFDNKCAYCGEELPLTQEHFLALSNGGEYTINNIIPSCLSCNCSKNDKDFFKWYPKYRYYSKKREKIILKYLHYEKNIQQLALTI